MAKYVTQPRVPSKIARCYWCDHGRDQCIPVSINWTVSQSFRAWTVVLVGVSITSYLAATSPCVLTQLQSKAITFHSRRGASLYFYWLYGVTALISCRFVFVMGLMLKLNLERLSDLIVAISVAIIAMRTPIRIGRTRCDHGTHTFKSSGRHMNRPFFSCRVFACNVLVGPSISPN